MAYVSVCPSGVILPYAGFKAPDGWLLCDGAEYSRTLYPGLWSAFSFTQNVTLTVSNTTVTTSSTANLIVGTGVYGTNIPSGAYVASITDSTRFVLSAPPTATSSVSATFSLYDRQINPTSNAIWTAPSSGNFRVPDMRASFLRGVGTPYEGDAVTLGGWQTHKTRKNGLTGSITSSTATSVAQNPTNHTHGGTSDNQDTNHSHTATSDAQSPVDHTHGGNTGYTDPSHRHQIPMGDIDDLNFTHVSAQNPTADGPNTHWTGSYTDNTSINHRHSFTSGNQSTDHSHYVSTGNQSASHKHLFTTGNQSASHTHDVTVSMTPLLSNGESETRPHNKGVLYIIKT